MSEPSLSDLLEILKTKGIELAGIPIRDVSGSGKLLLRVLAKRQIDGSVQPSQRALSAIIADLNEAGWNVESHIEDPFTEDIESGLRALFKIHFGGHIRSVFVSTNGKSARVWYQWSGIGLIEPTHDISERAKGFLEQYGLELSSISSIDGQSLPSDYAILSLVRRYGPCSTEKISERLDERKFSIPSLEWLSRRLETLRRKGRIIWLASGEYTCTWSSVQSLGTSKDRTSADISRMLALARRGS